MTTLTLDIETIPGQAAYIREDIAETITAPGQYKKQESIDKWLAENKEAAIDEKWRQTALNGSLGEVICIGWAIDDDKPKSVQRSLEQSEASVLCQFFGNLAAELGSSRNGTQNSPDLWVGHNHTGFDLRFIWQRCVINKIKPSITIPISAKPWDGLVFDTMVEWRGIGAKAGGSMKAVCKALGIEGKGDIDGSMVWDYVKDGRIDEVAKYCREDVERTREIYNRITFKN